MTIKIAVCGCGAIGSQVALMIAQPDMAFVLIDDDRIEENNLFTSAYSRQHIGAFKATVLGELLYRKAGCVSEIHNEELTKKNRPMLAFCDLVLDCFDNVAARDLTTVIASTLHIGVSQERTGAVTWNHHYYLPSGLPRGQEQFCTHYVGRRIIRFTAAVAANVIDTWLTPPHKRISLMTTEERIIEYA